MILRCSFTDFVHLIQMKVKDIENFLNINNKINIFRRDDDNGLHDVTDPRILKGN